MKVIVHIQIILATLLILTGCSMFDNSRQETTEAMFDHIHVRNFEKNKLQFEGTRKDKTYTYVYDMDDAVLIRRKGSIQREDVVFTNDNLGRYGNVMIQTSNGKNRLILEQSKGDHVQLVQVDEDDKLFVSVAPNQAFLVYWTYSDNKSDVYIYDLDRKEEKQIATLSGDLEQDDVSWSVDSSLVMLQKTDVYRVSDGEALIHIEDGRGYWSPVADELLIIYKEKEEPLLKERDDIHYGHRLIKYNVVTEAEEPLFHVEAEDESAFILGEIVTDASWRYIAFATGRATDADVYYEKVHIMDLQGGFHYIENEQNLRPSTLRDVSFSPDSQYVTYTANGLLKVLHIPSQKSKVFDVYPHLDEDESRYLIYGQEGVWILGSNDVRFLTRQLDENIVYETADELVHFFITDAEDKLLIIERRDRTYTLKLVPLFEDEEDTTGDGAHQFSTIKG